MLNNRIIKYIIGILLMPILYARYSIVLFTPLILNDLNFIILWMIYAIMFAFIMGICGVIKYWTKLFVWILRINYKVTGQWNSDSMYSFNIWWFPILNIGDKEYRLTISTSGGNIYEPEDNLRRKAIVYWLFLQ